MVTDEPSALAGLQDGMTVAIGGFANSGHPMSLVREVIRRRPKDLTIVGAATSGLEVDMLIAAGCVKKVISPYVGGETIVGIGPAFRRCVENGEIDVWEIDEAMYYCALNAAAQRLPFLPWRALVGTSFPEVNPDLVLFDDPVAGEPLLAVPAVSPDIALLHAGAADPYGNIQHVGSGFGDRAIARASDHVIVSVEKVISNEELRRAPEKTSIPLVDAVVRAPFGAHPFSSVGWYLEDVPLLKEYVAAAEVWRAHDDRSAVDAFLDTYIHQPEDHMDYLQRIGARRIFGLNEF
ncbi:CoA transferase subunit A [Nocardioides halotolerans]|uniref:CoA transferase subunit A n=1 Tax=Nocardioides halotolerans TaxID=433660 RepID=UPI0004267FEF|nr:CoA-transferase [Nocardioides halotolerans]